MKSKDRLTDSIVESIIREKHPGKVVVEDTGLIEKLSSPQQSNKSRNSFFKTLFEKESRRFFLIVSMFFVMLVLVVGYAFYYINDVILYESEFFINEQGSFNPKKSLDCDYALFLFNTSDVWANSGIQVNENDRIKINISGGFNTSIKNVIEAADSNRVLKYSWMHSDSLNILKSKNGNDIKKLKYSLSRKEKEEEPFNFGTVFYTIQPESSDITSHPLKVKKEDLKKWTKDNNYHKVEKSGYLYFAVNDLVFDELDENGNMINNHRDYFNEKQDSFDTKKTKIREELQAANNDSLKKISLNYQLSFLNQDNIEDQYDIEQIEKDPLFYYEDNLGQLLVAVEIQHFKPFYWANPITVFRWMVYQVDKLEDRIRANALGKWIIPFAFIETIGYFIVFFIGITLIFLVWVIIYLVFITIVYYAISGLFMIIDMIIPKEKEETPCT